jgi:hypothetical protein
VPRLLRHPRETSTRGGGRCRFLGHLRSEWRLRRHQRPVQPAPKRTRMRRRRAQAVLGGRTGLGTGRSSSRAHGDKVRVSNRQERARSALIRSGGRLMRALCAPGGECARSRCCGTKLTSCFGAKRDKLQPKIRQKRRHFIPR